MADWLNGLSAGDEVLISWNAGNTVMDAETIDYVTKTLIVVGSIRFSRRHGYQIGTRTHPARLIEATPEMIEQVKNKAPKSTGDIIADKLRSTRWETLSLDQLRRVAAIVREGKDE